MKYPMLSKELQNEKIHRLIGKACKILVDTKATLGSKIDYMASGSFITTKLWGFNATRKAMVVEVIINGAVIDKVEVVQSADTYTHRYNPKFNYLYRYKLATGQNIPA